MNHITRQIKDITSLSSWFLSVYYVYHIANPVIVLQRYARYSTLYRIICWGIFMPHDNTERQ